MPLFEYACLECGNRFEELRSASAADSPSVCEECKSPRVKRLLSVFATPRGRSADGEAAPSFSGGCACGGACSCQN